MKFQKTEKGFLVFESLGKLSWIMGLEIIWNIHCKSLRQKGTNLLTNARGKFKLWKMAEKIRTCDIRRIDRDHNFVCDVGLNVTILDVGLRRSDVSRPESRPDPIGGSEPVSGTRDSELGLFT